MPYGPKRLGIEEATKIRILYNTGLHTQKMIAEMFEVSQSLVCKIVNNQVHKADSKIGGQAVVRIGLKYGD